MVEIIQGTIAEEILRNYGRNNIGNYSRGNYT